jgi:methionine--tRNA ligase beta chain
MSVTMKDFERLSLKVAKVTAAENIPGMSKICKVQVDIGERVAQAIAGGAQFYDPKSLIGKRVIVLANMEGRTIASVKSEVMLLAADLQGKPVWLTVDEDVPPGTKVR